MSFVLPGNERQLRFTGEAKIVEPEEVPPPAALGRPRVRRQPAAASAERLPSPRPAEMSSDAPGRVVRTPVNPPQREDEKAVPVPRVRASSVRRKLDELASRWPAGGRPATHVGGERHSTDAGEPRTTGFDDDDNPTTAMARDAADALPGLDPYRTPKPVAVLGGAAPIPHFRAANPAVQTAIIPERLDHRAKAYGSRAPLGVWIVASILAGLVSYHVAPEMMARFDTSAGTAAR